MKSLNAILAISLICLAPYAYSRDTTLIMPVQAAMQSSDYKEKLDPGMRFIFGKQKTPEVIASYGQVSTNKKTNAFGKSDEKACRWVMLSALIALQNTAKSQGGNAVINITSNYKGKKVDHLNKFECHVGAIMAGVALRGDVVKLAK